MRAIAEQDTHALTSLFTTPLTFRAVTPRRFWDADTPVGVADIVLGTWFGTDEMVTGVIWCESDTVGDVMKVTYRLAIDVASGARVVEQVAYFSVRDGLICDMRLVCSGFRPA